MDGRDIRVGSQSWEPAWRRTGRVWNGLDHNFPVEGGQVVQCRRAVAMTMNDDLATPGRVRVPPNSGFSSHDKGAVWSPAGCECTAAGCAGTVEVSCDLVRSPLVGLACSYGRVNHHCKRRGLICTLRVRTATAPVISVNGD